MEPPPPPPPLPPPPRVAPPEEKGDVQDKIILILVALMVGLTLGYAFYGLSTVMANKKAAEAARQAREAANRKAHEQVLHQIDLLRVQGKELPPCPLVFPLLDKSKKLTAIGGYLSFLAMKRAAYLPESVFRIPNADQIFSSFNLFNPAENIAGNEYLTELPFRFQTKDFGEGRWIQTKRGYQIQLRFYGSHPAKNYKKSFKNNQLHLAPEWMASCLHDWAGFKPTEAQKAYLAKPTFQSDSDLKRAVADEKLLWTAPKAVCGWDAILAKNPEDSLLFDRWLTIQDDREGHKHLPLIEPLFQKCPQDDFIRADYAYNAALAQQYDAAIKVYMDSLMRDDNNSHWYEDAVWALQKKGYWEESIDLLTTWCGLHPDNPEAWMDLADDYLNWSWKAHGNDWSVSATEETRKLMKERMQKGLEAAQKAAQLAPQDCRVWSELERFGISAGWDRDQMQQYFQKAVALNPYRRLAYEHYLVYLKPRWFGSEKEEFEFARKYKDLYPDLVVKAATDSFINDDDYRSTTDPEKRIKLLADKVKKSPHWKECQEAFQEELRRHPAEMDNWKDYSYWAQIAGQGDEVLAFAKGAIPGGVEYAALYPYLELLSVEEEKDNQATSAGKNQVEDRPDVVKLKGNALRKLVALEPTHWRAWNQLAQYCVRHQFKEEAVKAFRALGEHRDDGVWGQKEFDQAKASLGLMPAPTPLPLPGKK